MKRIQANLINLAVICSLSGCAQPKQSAPPVIASESQATSGPSVVAMIAENFPEDKEVMEAISWCESGLVHRVNGELLRNREGGSALGTFQVLMRVHRAQIEKMGLDPNVDQEYMAYVKYIKRHQGLAAWNPSKPCWGPLI